MYDKAQRIARESRTGLGTSDTAEARRRFEDRFGAALRRLDEVGRALGAWEEENMLSAVGAAGLGEYELAVGLVEAALHPPALSPAPGRPARACRRLPMSVAALRRHFERMRAASD